MKYEAFMVTLLKAVDEAALIFEANDDMQETVKAVLAAGRGLSAQEAEREYIECLDLTERAEDHLLAFKLKWRKMLALSRDNHGYEPLKEPLFELDMDDLTDQLDDAVNGLLAHVRSTPQLKPKIPDAAVAALKDMKGMRAQRKDYPFDTEEMVKLLASLSLQNCLYDAAKGVLEIKDSDELERMSRKLRGSFFSDRSAAERRLLCSAVLLNLRRRGMLPPELDAQEDGKTVLSDEILCMMFMYAADGSEAIAKADREGADVLQVIWDLMVSLLLMPSLIATGVVSVLIITEQIFPLAVALVASALCAVCFLLVAITIWARIKNIYRELHIEKNEAYDAVNAFDSEMRDMAKRLFTEGADMTCDAALDVERAMKQRAQAGESEAESAYAHHAVYQAELE